MRIRLAVFPNKPLEQAKCGVEDPQTRQRDTRQIFSIEHRELHFDTNLITASIPA